METLSIYHPKKHARRIYQLLKPLKSLIFKNQLFVTGDKAVIKGFYRLHTETVPISNVQGEFREIFHYNFFSLEMVFLTKYKKRELHELTS